MTWLWSWFVIGILLMNFAAIASFLSGLPVEALITIVAIGYLALTAIALIADRFDPSGQRWDETE